MSQNLYVTGAERGSGKSAIVLGMMEFLLGHAGKVGFFRPVISAAHQPDRLIHLLATHYQLDFSYASMYGCNADEAHELLEADRNDELLSRILDKYRRLEAMCDSVLCAGTDYFEAGHSASEFDFNADVANNLGCLIMPVVRGDYRTVAQIIDATSATGESGKGQAVDKVREATRIAKKLRPDLKLDGPLQYDAAVDASVARTKLPGSEVAGSATVFIFPDLNTGNNTYKAVQRSARAVAIGPILQGLNKSVNDLSRGCTVTDILNTVAITAIQAQTGAEDR